MKSSAPSQSLQWERVVLASILVVAAVLRLVALGDVPPGPSYDELQNARLSERVLAGQWAIYFPENFGQESFYPTLEALSVRLLGWNVVALRLPGALLGVLSVWGLYLVGRRLTDRRTALLAAAFHAVSFWSLLETRVGLETSLLPPLAGFGVLFLVRGLEGEEGPRWRSLLDFGLAGLFFGGHVYAYTPGRLMPLLPFFVLLYLLVFDRGLLRRRWFEIALLCLVTVLVIAPLVIFLRANPQAEVRLDQLSGPLMALRQGDVRPVLEITAGTLGMFIWKGDPQWLYNVADRPVFDPITALLFYLGLVISLLRLRRWRFGLVLLWLLAGLGPAFVSLPAGSFTHTLAAQPVVYLVLGVGIAAAWTWLVRWRAWAGPLLAALLLLAHLVLSCWVYFADWARASEVQVLYQGGVTAVARELDASDPPGPVAVCAPYVNYWHPWNAVGLDLALGREDLDVRWFNPAGGWVYPEGDGPVTFFFPTNPLGEQAFDPVLETIFLADAVLLPDAGDGFASYQVVQPVALEARLEAAAAEVAWPPERASSPMPTLPLAFGDRFALLGIELQQGPVAPGETLRLMTYWQVLAADSAPIVAFVHLTSDGQDIWGQQDWLDVWADGLQPGDRFVQVHHLSVDAGTPPGLYSVQLGLYAPDTLLRLPITVEGGDVVDRVWVGGVEVGSP